MSTAEKLQVAPPRGAQHATTDGSDATGHATNGATGSLKALAGAYLNQGPCNQPCNQGATSSSQAMQLPPLESEGKVASQAGSKLGGDPPGPARGIDVIIDVLKRQVGRPLGEELMQLMRQVMHGMSQQARAEMAASIDDCFEEAESDQYGRQQAETLMRQAIPSSEAPGNLSDALSWIDARCELVRDDRSFLGKCLAPLAQAEMTEAAERYVTTWQAAADAEPCPHRQNNAGRRAANRSLRGDTP